MLKNIFLLIPYLQAIYGQCCSQTEITCSNQQYATCDSCGFLEMCNTKNRKCNSCLQLIPYCNTCDCRNNYCISCLPQYYFDATRTQCLPYKACPLADCAAGYYANVQCKCVQCPISNCIICSRSNYCDTCRPDYFSRSIFFDSSDIMRCFKTNNGQLIEYNLDGNKYVNKCNLSESELTVGYACLSQSEIDILNSLCTKLISSLIIFII